MNRFFSLAFLACSLSFATQGLHAAEEAVGGKLEQYVDVALQGTPKRDFKRFQGLDGGFGTFYVSPDGKVTGWTARSFAKKDADELARVLCEIKSGSECVLYARQVPENAVRSVGLPKRNWRKWQAAIKSIAPDEHVALAISAYAVFAVSSPQSSKEKASADAMSLCGKAIKPIKSKLQPKIFEGTLKAGLFDCRVVAVK